jgi:integrative and conjugative element protein (TIGR02256 family)
MATVAETQVLQRAFTQEGETVRYAGACRDASVQLPQDVLAIHAGVAANFIKTNAFSVSPSIVMWEWSTPSHTLTRHQVTVHPVLIKQANGWTARISEHALDHVRFQRRRRLPCETGGVLLGQFDHENKIVYVGTILPSPPDSVEWPNAYIRGAVGLAAQVKAMNGLTGGQLNYVGEWHSHPTGNSPSATDQTALQSLARDMEAQGLPAVILIQGNEREPSLLVAPVNEEGPCR